MDPRLFAMLLGMGVFEDAPNIRQDAAETLFLARELEQIRAKTYDIEYPELKARKLFNVDTSINPGAETYTYRQHDFSGRSQIISNYTDDLPLVGLTVKEFSAPLKGIGNAYSYSLQDLRAAAFAKKPLTATFAKASRDAHENAIEYAVAFGIAEAGLYGVTNHPNIPEYSPITGLWISGTKTPTQILKDLHNLAYQVALATKWIKTANTMIMPTNLYEHIATTRVSDLSEVTILESFLKTSPYIKTVEQWQAFNAAGTPNGSRIMVYRKEEDVIAIIEAQAYEQLPPQAQGLVFKVNTHGRIGGVDVKYPKACGYMDGCD